MSLEYLEKMKAKILNKLKNNKLKKRIMELMTQSDYGMKNGKQLKSSTKVFKGSESLNEARVYAEEKRSYVFNVVENKRNEETGKVEKEFYGYGVPK